MFSLRSENSEVSDFSDLPVVRDMSRLSWVMVLRVVIISALLGATIAMNQSIDRMFGTSTRFLLLLIVCTYALTIVYAIWYKWKKYLRILGYVQFFTDALLFAALIYVTGGVTSGFTFLFHLWVIVAVVSMGKRAGFIQATISAAMILLVGVIIEVTTSSPIPDLPLPSSNPGTTLYALSVNVISLYVVAFLVNMLASRLEYAGEGLQKERAQKEELVLKLEHAERLAALGELAATLAHEIRNPLSAVSGSFQMMKSGLPLSEDDEALSSIIERELERMGRLVADILEYARPRETELYGLDISRLCNETVIGFEAGIRQRGIGMQTDVADDVWCMADSNQLRQVLWNLLVNASQAVADDTGIIRLTLVREDDAIELAVADNGPGVPTGIRNQIYEAFFSTRERGMGLGLALCHRIISAHGGTIEVGDSDLGGALFRMKLPALAQAGRDSGIQ
jgi:two-component system, NtrC family, sensor histidine kinase HydH